MILKIKPQYYFLPMVFVMYLVMQFAGYNFRGIVPVIIAFIYLTVFGKKSLAKFRINSLVKWYVLFMLYITVVFVANFSVGDTQDLSYYINNGVNLFILGGISIFMMSTRENVKRFYQFLKYLTVFLIIFGFIEYFTKDNFTLAFIDVDSYYQDYLKVYGRIFSVFQHPIGYAIYLNSVFVISLVYPFKNRFIDWMYKIGIILNIYMTQSRTSFVALVLSYVIYVCIGAAKGRYSNIKQRKIYNELIVIGTLLFVFLVYFMLNYENVTGKIEELFVWAMDRFSMKDQGIRIGILKNFYVSLKNMPVIDMLFGKGIGYSYYWMSQNGVPYTLGLWTETTDNMYVTVMLNEGLFGVCFFLWLPLMIIRNIIKSKHMSKEFIISSIISLIILFDVFLLEGLYWNSIFAVFVIAVTNAFSEVEVDE